MDTEEDLGGDNRGTPRTNRRTVSWTLFLTICVVAIVEFAVIIVAFYPEAFEPEEPLYESEDTPLSAQPWGVTYTLNGTESLSWMNETGFNLTSMHVRLAWSTTFDSDAVEPPFDLGLGVDLCNATQMPAEEFELEYNMECSRSIYSSPEGGVVEVLRGVFVTDTDGDGYLTDGEGFSMFTGKFVNGTLETSGIPEDAVLIIRWDFSRGGVSMYAEFKCALHEGLFYSWMDEPEMDPYLWLAIAPVRPEPL